MIALLNFVFRYIESIAEMENVIEAIDFWEHDGVIWYKIWHLPSEKSDLDAYW